MYIHSDQICIHPEKLRWEFAAVCAIAIAFFTASALLAASLASWLSLAHRATDDRRPNLTRTDSLADAKSNFQIARSLARAREKHAASQAGKAVVRERLLRSALVKVREVICDSPHGSRESAGRLRKPAGRPARIETAQRHEAPTHRPTNNR